MWDWDDLYAVARYSNFKIESENGDFTMRCRVPNAIRSWPPLHFLSFRRVSGYYRLPGDREAGDSLGASDGAKFSHRDRRRVQDRCFDKHGGMAGWYKDSPGGSGPCTSAHLYGKGLDTEGDATDHDYDWEGIVWDGFRGYRHSLKALHMRIRRKDHDSLSTAVNNVAQKGLHY